MQCFITTIQCWLKKIPRLRRKNSRTGKVYVLGGISLSDLRSPGIFLKFEAFFRMSFRIEFEGVRSWDRARWKAEEA